MLKYLSTLTAILFISMGSSAQTLTLVSPEGLMPPYEVPAGTELTFEWDSFGDPGTLFTHTASPELDPFNLNPVWTQDDNPTDNGDGTFSFTLTATQDLYVWGGYYRPFLTSWAYSNVIEISILSGVTINAEDGKLCPGGTGSELLTVEDEYDAYQWFKDGIALPGATAATYTATEAGAYRVQVPRDGEMVFSNTLTLTEIEAAVLGTLDPTTGSLTITAGGGFESYQWFAGPDTASLSPIAGATDTSLTVDLTDTLLYYALQGTLGECTVQSAARPVVQSAFAPPIISVKADSNSFGRICEGTPVELSVPDNYGKYSWSRDGTDVPEDGAVYNINSNLQQGTYTVAVRPKGWPNIERLSDSITVDYFELEEPSLFTSEPGPYCPGSPVSVVLSDEGYDYTWYEHTTPDYTAEDEVEVSGVAYTVDVQESVRITVVGKFQDCSAEGSVLLNSAAAEPPTILFTDLQKGQFLCPDSTIEMQLSAADQVRFENIQWFEEADTGFVAIPEATNPAYTVEETGVYKLTAELIECEGVAIESNTLEVVDYTERELQLLAQSTALCRGDSTTLFISGGGSWQNIQWFTQEAVLGSGGYVLEPQPLIEAGNAPSYQTDVYKTYQVRARHLTCPSGPKFESNNLQLEPKVNPQIQVDPNPGVNEYQVSAFDSVAAYLYCAFTPVDMSLPEGYDSYEWYASRYQGADDYELGSPLPQADGNEASFVAEAADYITVVVDSAGCVGLSDPILLDTRVFSIPAIASYNNAELCEEGDSVLLHVAFQGNYESFEWFRNGQLVPGSNNDTLYAKQPGVYSVTVYREECPDIGISSGNGPVVEYLEASIAENDTVIFALPQQGLYTYQWYLDGSPIPAPPSTPWLLYKENLEDGEYTVEVTNPKPCTAVSLPFTWSTVSTNEPSQSSLSVYPNPADTEIRLEGIAPSEIAAISVITATGRRTAIRRESGVTRIDVSTLAPGSYFLRIMLKGGKIIERKFLKM